ncbi:MAG: DNA primase [Actinomycetota bacterium]
MARIRQEDIEAVKERTNIVALVSQFLTLKKAGHDSMSGICPFHQEKTASFSVSPSKGVFYCFGCGKGGDAITFLRELESLSYVEAIERLASEAHVQLRYEGDSAAERRSAERRKALYRANEEASSLYRQMLAEGREAHEARAYAAERGLTAEAIEAFGIGYAPGYPDFVLRRLAGQRDLSPEILLEAGVATRGDDGVMRDRFRGRLTFPIHDLQGRQIGFGARILPVDTRASEQAKYLNTAETPIYRKQEILYNMHRARSAIARSGEAFVVEGYTDVIGLVQAGILNTVATCGTALGEKHFELLARFAQRAVLAFDSDEAGARAAERAFAFQERFPVQAVVMIMPDGLDPAEFVSKHGADEVLRAAKQARPIVEYMVRRTVGRHDLSSVEGRSAAVAEALPLLERLSDPVRRSEYVGLLADEAGVSEVSIVESLRRRTTGKPAAVAAAPTRGTAADRVEREMLRLFARGADTSFEGERAVTEDHFRNSTHRRLFSALRDAGGDVSSIAAGSDTELAAKASQLAVEPLDGEPTPEYVHAVWTRLEEFLLKTRSDQLRVRLQKMNPTTEPGYDSLFKELIEVDGELRRLRGTGSA